MWKYFEPEEAQWYQWRLHGSHAYLRKNGDEWRMAFFPVEFQELRPESGGPLPCDPPESAPIEFAVAHGVRVALRPRLSELPYLIMSRNIIRILPGADARFNVALPPVIHFELENGPSLGETLPFILSRTWFGDKTGGSLCLSMPTALDPRCRGEKEDRVPSNTWDTETFRSLVHCEINVRNESKTAVNLERFAIFTDQINIYESDGILTTDLVVVNSLADGGLKVSIEENKHRGTGKLVTGSRVGTSELLVRRGVNFLRTITGL